MDEIIALVLSGEASDIERQKLQRWRKKSPDNERYFQEMEHMWSISALQVLDGPISPPPPVNRILCEAERRRGKVVPIRCWSFARLGGLQWASIAAAAILVVSLGVFAFRDTPQAVYSTSATQTSTVALHDGSVVRLGPSSNLTVWSADSRSVSFDGTAFFAVAPDPSKPFTIRTDAGSAEVLGTRFEMRANPDSMRLVVVEGRVALAAEGERVEVGKGTVSTIYSGSAPALPRSANVWDLLQWSEGLLIFQSTPLRQVMEEVSAHFGVSVAINDSILADRSVTAWFGDETLDQVVNTICQVVGARCTVGDVVEVTR